MTMRFLPTAPVSTLQILRWPQYLLPAVAAALAGLLLAGCTTPSKTDAPTSIFDFGGLRPAPGQPALPAGRPISVAEIHTPSWLDSTAMFYRLSYANEQQPRPYAHSRWSMPPAQLFSQRLKDRIAQAGGAPLSAADGAVNVPVLRMEAVDFMQTFEAPGASFAQVAVRAAVFQGRTLIAQKSFLQRAPAPSADAAGGAKAFSDASDAMIADMIAWLAALPPTLSARPDILR
jgi:cholesterol transport system auxiliary component